MNNTRWDQDLLRKHLAGREAEVVLRHAEALLDEATRAGGGTVVGAYVWMVSHHKELAKRINCFNTDGLDQTAAHLLVFDQLALEERRTGYDEAAIDRLIRQIEAEARSESDGTPEGMRNWLAARRADRLSPEALFALPEWREFRHSWGLVEKRLVLANIPQREATIMSQPELFTETWHRIRKGLRTGLSVRNWTRAGGYLGDRMTIESVDDSSVTVIAPRAGNPQVIPREEFEKVWHVWQSYKAGQTPRNEIRDVTRFSKYIISILHTLETTDS